MLFLYLCIHFIIIDFLDKFFLYKQGYSIFKQIIYIKKPLIFIYYMFDFHLTMHGLFSIGDKLTNQDNFSNF